MVIATANGPSAPSRSPMRTAGSTDIHEALMDSAERLVAERGSEAASSRAIILGAGQRHNSAITYHFGSRQKLFDAVWLRGSAVVNDRRREMIGSGRTQWSLEDLVDIYVTPFAAYVDSRRPSYWARLNEEALRTYPLAVAAHMRSRLDEYPDSVPMDTLTAIFDRMQWLIAGAVRPVPALRVSIAVRAVISTFAAWEREAQQGVNSTSAIELGEDLKATVLAILTGPAR